jgi:hypothetical protein
LISASATISQDGWPAGALRFRPELGRYVIFRGQRRAYALMLKAGHHDGKGSSPVRIAPRIAMVLQLIQAVRRFF